MTENAVFVLLASTRIEQHNFDYWIPTIQQFGGDSPIIIGQTCHDGNAVNWPELNRFLGNGKFNIIKTGPRPYTDINLCEGNKGLEAISSIIKEQLLHLPHCKKSVPATWVEMKKSIAADAG